MKNTLFIQFYELKNTFNQFTAVVLSNGFSDTYDLCKSKGDFLWVDIVESRKLNYKIELPIQQGVVYVSCFFEEHIYQTFIWSKIYKNIKFVVGGPSVSCNIINEIPSNLIITEKTVEQYFDVDDFPSSWNIDELVIKHNIPHYFSYTIDSKCYWGKCIFCDYNNNEKRIRTKFGYEFSTKFPEKQKTIFLNSPALKPKFIEEIIPNLPHDSKIVYSLFIIPNKKTNKALNNVLSLVSSKKDFHLYISIGLELPSKRMLKYMKKGTNLEDFIETVSILKKYQIKLSITCIVGWNNIISSDIEETINFIKKLPNQNEYFKPQIRINKLFVRTKTSLHEMLKNENKHEFIQGPFYHGFTLMLNKEQQKLNMKLSEVIKQGPYETINLFE